MPENKRQVGVQLYGPALEVNDLLLWLLDHLKDHGYKPELSEVRDDDDGQGRTACISVRWDKP